MGSGLHLTPMHQLDSILMVKAGSVISQLEELNINSIKIEIQYLDLRDSMQLNIQNWQYPNIPEERW